MPDDLAARRASRGRLTADEQHAADRMFAQLAHTHDDDPYARRALVIPADPMHPVAELDCDGSLRRYQALVGGYIEGVGVPGRHDVLVFVDGDGLCKPRPRRNARASLLTGLDLVGDAVVVGVTASGREVDCPLTADALDVAA